MTYTRGTIEMARFLSELKQHQEGKNSKFDELTPATRLFNRLLKNTAILTVYNQSRSRFGRKT